MYGGISSMDKWRGWLAAGLLCGAAPSWAGDFLFVTNADDTITITGYTGWAVEVTVPANIEGRAVTAIGTNAFSGRHAMSGITIPNAVTNIGQSAFEWCPSLESISIPLGVADVRQRVFFNCTGLSNVVFHAGVTNIDNDAFGRCDGLSAVTLPGGVVGIGAGAFAACRNLREIAVAPDNPRYESHEGALYENGQTMLVQCPAGLAGNYAISGSAIGIGEKAFEGCALLTDIEIPFGVVDVGGRAFALCTALTSLVLPDTVTNVGADAFIACTRLARVEIGSGVAEIGPRPFASCSNLTEIVVSVANPHYRAVDGVLYSSDLVRLIQYPRGRSGDFVVPDGVGALSDFSFMGSLALGRVVIPDSVAIIGESAFAFCGGLVQVCFQGTPPLASASSFADAGNVRMFFLPDAPGWGETFGGRPTALWVPRISEEGLGMQSDRFGFRMNWAAGHAVVVEACTNLAAPAWLPLATNELADGTGIFEDEEESNPVGRFYRVVPAP